MVVMVKAAAVVVVVGTDSDSEPLSTTSSLRPWWHGVGPGEEAPRAGLAGYFLSLRLADSAVIEVNSEPTVVPGHRDHWW